MVDNISDNKQFDLHQNTGNNEDPHDDDNPEPDLTFEQIRSRMAKIDKLRSGEMTWNEYKKQFDA